MEFLLLIILGLLLLSWLFVRLLPMFLSRWVNKKMGGDMGQRHRKQRGEKVGDVYITNDQKSQQEKVVNKDMGEYVDFEPVKENKNANI